MSHAVLIAGASGFVGRALATRLLADGHDVRCLARATSGPVPGTRLVLEAITADGVTRALDGFRPDVVYNLASYGVRPEDRDPHEMLVGNVGVAAALVAAGAGAGARAFVQVGSCSEYAPAPEGHRIDHEHPIAPPSLYGSAKAAAGLFARGLARSLRLPLVTLRPFGIYGPGEGPWRLVPYLLARLRRGEPVDLTPGEQHRDLTYIDDVVEALVLAADLADAEAPPVLNVCTGVAVRIRDVALEVAAAVGASPDRLRFGARPHRADEPRWVVGDPGPFTAVTGWVPQVPLAEGIRRMVALG